MSDPSAPSLPIARATAVVLSLGLGLFVVVNAQFGCDAPASSPPPAEAADKATSEPAKAEASAEPTAKTEAKAEPENTDPTNAEPEPDPSANAEAKPAEAPGIAPPTGDAPVFMPASKSGGDFGAMRFPGEKQDKGNSNKSNQAQQQAPNQAVQQQAQHGG